MHVAFISRYIIFVKTKNIREYIRVMDAFYSTNCTIKKLMYSANTNIDF